jgi:hypothetical protein
MTTAHTHIGARASGAWSAEEGTAVVCVETAPNGRATRVMLPAAHPRRKKAGSWLPTSWISGIEPQAAPEAEKAGVCPTCGRSME